VSLPGFASEIRTKDGVHLLLGGTLPEFNQSSPTLPFLFECAVTLHENPKVDLEFTLNRGRVYLSSHKDKPAQVRVRFGKEIWDIVLQDRDTEIVLELFTRYTDHINYLDGEEPLSNLTLFAAKGKASLKYDKYHEVLELEEPPGPALVVWNNMRTGAEGPYKVDKDNIIVTLLGKEPTDEKSVKAAKEFRPALDEISKHVSDKKSVEISLLEGIKTSKFPDRKALCIYCLGAIDAASVLLDILGNEEATAGLEREDAIIALRRWICRGPQTVKLLYDAKANEGLLLKKGFKASEADSMLQMLYLQLSEATAKRKDTYEVLAGYLRHSKMPIRQLAYYHLKQLTFGVKGLPENDPSWTQERRNKAADKWEDLIMKGELPKPMPK
jgi:hypothetical protein